MLAVAVLLALQVLGVPEQAIPVRYDLRPHYRVAEIGNAGIPKLDGAQSAWVRKILRTKFWYARRDELWFLTPKNHDELVVFYAPGGIKPDRGYQIIGAGCNVLAVLETSMDAVQVTPGGDDPCDPDPLRQ